MNIGVRRSLPSDASIIHKTFIADNFSYKTRHGASLNASELIEKSFLSITAVDDVTDKILGFVSISDTPSTTPGFPASKWEEFLKCGWLDPKWLTDVKPSNSLWLTCIAIGELPTDENTPDPNHDASRFSAAQSDYQYEIAAKMLTTAFATVPDVNVLLMALPASAVPFGPVCDGIFRCMELSGSRVEQDSAVFHEESEFEGTVYKLTRQELVPELILRPGVVEDFDDLRPLLRVGNPGIVTPIPEDFYLEKLLQGQDEYHAVVVAEDRETHRVVGLMCLKATVDEQHFAVKQYKTDVFGKLKPIFPQQQHKGQQAGHNVVRISFFYLDPEYDTRAGQFIPHIFNMFKFAEYTLMYLPHAAPVHALLHHFSYVPIRKTQGGSQPDQTQIPEGLYLACRYTYETLEVAPAASIHENAVHKMLSHQAELSQDLSETISHAFTQSIPVVKKEDQSHLPFSSFVVIWGESVVGLVVTTKCSVEELYALRANFDLEQFVNFNPKADTDYHVSDIAVDPFVAPSTYYRDEMPALVVKFCYIKPVFRSRLRFVLREALRHTSTELLLYSAGVQTEIFQPLVNELILAPPRRVTEFETGDESPAAQGQDVDSLICLHHTTRKSLSDEKTKVNARIVVVGSGTTGLAFIYSLLTIPYLHFSNILLVSQDGLPEHPQQRAPLMWTADTMDWTEREYLALKVGKKVSVTEGTMVDFDFNIKYIFTDNPTCEPYDHLILTAGRQYAIPKDITAKQNGVFPLSNATTISRIKTHIHESEIYEDERSRTVIYGANLDVYAIASCVINLGLAPQRIVLVFPEADEGFSPFGDPEIDAKVNTLFETLGIKQYFGYCLERLDYDEDNSLNMVVIAKMTSAGDAKARAEGVKIEDIDATMFIYAHEKDIDGQVLTALNKRSIVFDGRVIVENSYRTTNKNIYAAGPVAMFSRRFGPSNDFDIYNALEVGKHLSGVVLGFLGIDEFVDPELMVDDRDYVPKDNPLAAALGHEQLADEGVSRKRPKALPQYLENVCRRVTLPGGHTYFCSHTIDYYTLKSEDLVHLSYSSKSNQDKGNKQTGDDDEAAASSHQSSYVRITLGPTKRIEAVLFLGQETRELLNLRSLVGTMESTLNLLYNYNEHKDKGGLDILAYLRSIWARAIFHDRFASLVKRIKDRLSEHAEVTQVKELLLNSIREKQTTAISEEERRDALLRLTDHHSEARRVVELELVKFLHEHKAFVPQYYFLPNIKGEIEE